MVKIAGGGGTITISRKNMTKLLEQVLSMFHCSNFQPITKKISYLLDKLTYDVPLITINISDIGTEISLVIFTQ